MMLRHSRKKQFIYYHTIYYCTGILTQKAIGFSLLHFHSGGLNLFWHGPVLASKTFFQALI